LILSSLTLNSYSGTVGSVVDMGHNRMPLVDTKMHVDIHLLLGVLATLLTVIWSDHDSPVYWMGDKLAEPFLSFLDFHLEMKAWEDLTHFQTLEPVMKKTPR